MNSKYTEIMAVQFQTGPKTYGLLIVLRDGNLERIKDYDPADIPLDKVIEKFPGMTVSQIVIAYGTEAEVKAAIADKQAGKSFKEAMGRFSRGWKFRPELGDSNDGPEEIKGGSKWN